MQTYFSCPLALPSVSQDFFCFLFTSFNTNLFSLTITFSLLLSSSFKYLRSINNRGGRGSVGEYWSSGYPRIKLRGPGVSASPSRRGPRQADPRPPHLRNILIYYTNFLYPAKNLFCHTNVFRFPKASERPQRKKLRAAP